jgi:TorA maturation chaperone TorD
MPTTATTESADREDESRSREDSLRAATYALLGRLLSAPPDGSLLDRLGDAGDGRADALSADALSEAWSALAHASGAARPTVIDDEFHGLFIGLGRGELVPYASWYMTGFLMERPLGELRRDLAQLGIERAESVREPEDHAAALCQVMALLIDDPAYGSEQERDFYSRHIEPWMKRFFGDLESAEGAVFYRQVGRLGRHFIELEEQSQPMSV